MYERNRIGKSMEIEGGFVISMGWVGGNMECLFNGYGVVIWGDENFLN